MSFFHGKTVFIAFGHHLRDLGVHKDSPAANAWTLEAIARGIIELRPKPITVVDRGPVKEARESA